ncbi:hypothetical protein RIF23_06705 [Lipingzhangella sp. LS1_29]|uniref:Uncharacterized protein n=1 Tax=Lipingzhangella rawalii TaxID=2055835 RepID=A0ABU2H3V2_9ACTN|nr:hypothetical protein [Lipingzhangella rawalii]MDS1269981.1 hypothetical protein [Lipingzhangella rawalii]
MSQQARAVTLVAAGALLVLSFVWWQSLALSALGAMAAGAGLAWLLSVRRWTADQREQEPLIRRLWDIARTMPRDTLLVDPVTGTRFCIERTRGFLSLATAEFAPDGAPGADLTAPQREATVTRYMLGFLTTPLPPPLYRHIHGLEQDPPQRMSWSQAAEVARLNDLTGVLEASAPELEQLAVRLERAMPVDPPH